MATGFSFDPEALFEYAEATNYYLRKAPPDIADGFVAAVEAAIADLVAAPTRPPIV